MKTVDEQTNFDVVARFRNGTSASLPNTAWYRIDCRTTKQVIQDWQEITPAESVTISILPEWNKILDSTNLIEQKSITVSANRGTSIQRNRSYTWEVKNLLGVL